VGFVLILLLTTACTTRVTGHTSPIAHDYGPVEWRGLQQTVVQPFVTGPGHQAAIANDGKTTPAQFQERLAALPEDARNGTLQEIKVGLRLAGEQGIEESGTWSTDARVQIVDANGAVLLDTSLDALPRDGDWLRIEQPPDLAPGQVVDLRIVPGDGADAARLEYGVTRDRAPYGGWIATNEAGENAGGALLLRTTYERDVALRSIVGDAASNLRDGASSDVLFGALWVLALAGLVVAAGWFWRKPAREG
jgi:hypothetical protein